MVATRPATTASPTPTTQAKTADSHSDKMTLRTKRAEIVQKRNELPIKSFKLTIMSTIDANPVTILVADTGSGKSTQVAQYALEAGYRKVIVTQPRRLAAMSVGERVAEEYDASNAADGSPEIPFGDVIGFRTAFDRKVSKSTRCTFVTDGLAHEWELGNNRDYDLLIIDEVHEWNLYIEVMIAFIRHRILRGEVGVKVVLMSATLDADRLSTFLGNAPIVRVPGRTHPVEILPRTNATMEEDVAMLLRQGHNVLVFQPGKREIMDTIARLDAMGLNAAILPLHGELTKEEQKACFDSHSQPKCVVSTNVAQTSVTIPDITAVVDSGMERRIETVDGVEGLYLRPISLADAAQRRGRAGRTRPGVYIDWCREAERTEYPVAEMLRVSKDGVMLRLAVIGIDIEGLEFFNQPSREELANARRTLVMLGCMDDAKNVTPIGRRVVKLPVSVRHGRMLVAAEKFGVVDQMIGVVAVLEQGGIVSRICGPHMNEKRLTEAAIADRIAQLTEQGMDPDKATREVKRSREYRVKRSCTCWQKEFAPNEAGSDIIAQWRAFEACSERKLKSQDMRDSGIFAKSYFEAVKQATNIRKAVSSFKRNRQGDRTDMLRAICAGMADKMYHITNGKLIAAGQPERTLTDDTVIRASSGYVVGDPFDIETPNATLHKVRMATQVNVKWLPEAAPQVCTIINHPGPYDPNQKGHLLTREYWFNDRLLETRQIVDYTYLTNKRIAAQALRDEVHSLLEQYRDVFDDATYEFLYNLDLDDDLLPTDADILDAWTICASGALSAAKAFITTMEQTHSVSAHR
jgi:HrpA-like RNA helicase